MEQLPPRPEGGHEQPLPGDEDPGRHTVGFEFGRLNLVPPEGSSWGEWVISRGIAAAEQEDRPIDNRTAYYIATWLRRSTTPALRDFALIGVIDGAGIQEELVHHFFRATEQVQSWIDWLGQYCMQRLDYSPVEGWRQDIDGEDRAEVIRLRRQELLAQLDELFLEQSDDEMGDVSELGWFGMVVHHDRPGGVILAQNEHGFRHVWETDRSEELAERWQEIAGQYLDFYRRTRLESRARSEERFADDEDSRGAADS